ncbi:MAG: S9 family peptidase [Bacteroidia bacterium]|nr:S9 family peptidase [Bacteroidia bacterium]
MKNLIFFLITLPVLTMAQNKLSTEKLWQLGRISDPQTSPNGKMLLYGIKTYDVKLNKGTNIIYIKSLTTGEPIAITEAKNNASSARFTPDGKKVSFMSAESGDMQLWEMNTNGSNKTQVTKIKGGIGGYKYSPKLTHIAFVADVKLDKEVKELYPDLDKTNARIIDGLFYRHWDAWHDYAYSHLFIVAYANGVITGEPTDLLKDEKYDCPIPPNGDDEAFNWNTAGTKIAYDCKKLTGTADALSTNSDIYLYDLNTRKTINISEENKGFDRNPQFSPDGTKIAWLSMATAGYESDRNTLVMFELNKDKEQKKSNQTVYSFTRLTHNFDNSIEHYAWVDTERLAFTATMEATKQIFLFDPKIKSLSQVVPLTEGLHDYGAISIVNIGNDPQIVGVKMSISMPADLYLVGIGQKKETQLTFANQALLKETLMGKVEKRVVKTTDGKNMLVWVIFPPDFDAAKKYPTLLYCQGGPQSPVSQFFSYRWNFQLMAAHGYIVVAPNRRGLPGFGSEWNDAIKNDYGGQCMKDYLSAIDDVAKEPYVNKDKLGAVGASFGGYSVYWLAGNHNKRFKAFIAHCGMFNMESWYGSTEEMFFANHDNNGPYWSQPSSPNNFDASPHKFVKNWDAPMLVIHNEKDYRVPITQGMEAFTAAQIKGVPSRFLYFPDENHWVVKPQNSILWQRVFFEWLDKYLK